jgi:hypothetical protein
MRLMARSCSLAVVVSTLVVTLVACAATPTSAGQTVNQPGDFTGKVVGPLEFGQPAEGAGLKAYGLELSKALTLNDKAECGEQRPAVLAIESDAVAAHVGKTVVLRATPYCRVSRSGKYHLKDVSVR